MEPVFVVHLGAAIAFGLLTATCLVLWAHLYDANERVEARDQTIASLQSKLDLERWRTDLFCRHLTITQQARNTAEDKLTVIREVLGIDEELADELADEKESETS